MTPNLGSRATFPEARRDARGSNAVGTTRARFNGDLISRLVSFPPAEGARADGETVCLSRARALSELPAATRAGHETAREGARLISG